MKHILISGASGLIGKALTQFLSKKGYTVYALNRSAPLKIPSPLDAVIHLAGRSIGDKRWSDEEKKRLWESRVTFTKALTEAVEKLPTPPKVFLSASAIGYYGDRNEEELTESSSSGSGFLADLCREWELSLTKSTLITRKIQLRLGVVLSKEGGALSSMLLPYQLGLGGPLGSGKQWVSWIHIEDLCEAIHHLLTNNSSEGAYNIVAPTPVRNEEFSLLLAKVLARPHVFRVPSLVLKILFGQMASELLLGSTRTTPEKLKKEGFCWRFQNLEEAFKNLLQT